MAGAFQEGAPAPGARAEETGSDRERDRMPFWVHGENGRKVAGLTVREQQVFKLLLADAKSAAVGIELGISQKTAEAHVASIYRKLGAHTRLEALAAAFAKRLLTVDEWLELVGYMRGGGRAAPDRCHDRRA